MPKRKIYRDWSYKARKKIKSFARRHGLTAIVFRPPHESWFIRVWFDLDNPKQVELELRARRLYGNTRGGYTA